MEELFRFLIDLSVIRAFEIGIFNKSDFQRDKEYLISLTESGTKKMIVQLKLTFNSPVKYKGKNWKWDYLIELKFQELKKAILNNDKEVDFTQPIFQIGRTDNSQVRELIQKISYTEWKNLGFSKGSLHYLKTHDDNLSFKIYSPVIKKLELYRKAHNTLETSC